MRVQAGAIAAAIVLGAILGALVSCSKEKRTEKRFVHEVRAGPHAESDLQGALILAKPGDVIELGAGVYELDQDLLVTADNVTIRGYGMKSTVLSFAGQRIGSKGLEATGDNFVIEDLAIENTNGTALKVRGAEGVIIRGVRVEWTGEPSSDNGAYGIYPVQCRNVLVEGCFVAGASDAGIYVGQSTDVVVRACRAERNVAGIEIENCVRADVYTNVATNNTGGLLVFDLPGLGQTNGRQIRVYGNMVFDNSHFNFAAPGAIVGTVPPGTGVMIIATDEVEVFRNEIHGHRTANVSVLSYLITGRKIKDSRYDPFPESISIVDNEISNGGENPTGRMADLLRSVAPTFPDVFYDGIVNPAKLKDGRVPEELALRIRGNGAATFRNFHLGRHPMFTDEEDANDWAPSDDLSTHDFDRAMLTTVELEPLAAPERSEDPTLAMYRAAPKKLSEYGLLRLDEHRLTTEPAEGVLPYDINTELFADYKTKHRLIRLPEGETMTYRARDVFDFPVGTILVKSFSAPADRRRPDAGERVLETRLLVRNEDGWHGLPYVWNEDETEATLRLGGGAVDVEWIHDDGTKRSSPYLIPNANQCKSCHEIGGKMEPLGPKARNLNRSFTYTGRTENQLGRWTRLGKLEGAPSPDRAPKAPCVDDASTGSVADRARIWLDVNCAHCHRPDGPASAAGLDLRLEQDDPSRWGVWKSPVAAGRASGKLRYGIVPGKPEESILVYRIASTDPGIMMPELPRQLVPEEALEVVRQWIRELPDAAAGDR